MVSETSNPYFKLEVSIISQIEVDSVDFESLESERSDQEVLVAIDDENISAINRVQDTSNLVQDTSTFNDAFYEMSSVDEGEEEEKKAVQEAA